MPPRGGPVARRPVNAAPRDRRSSHQVRRRRSHPGYDVPDGSPVPGAPGARHSC